MNYELCETIYVIHKDNKQHKPRTSTQEQK